MMYMYIIIHIQIYDVHVYFTFTIVNCAVHVSITDCFVFIIIYFGVNFQVSSTTYVIEGLESSTDYEVQVCIVNDTSNCGNCTYCFTTGMEDGRGINSSVV